VEAAWRQTSRATRKCAGERALRHEVEEGTVPRDEKKENPRRTGGLH
jgi:hypothetical protein